MSELNKRCIESWKKYCPDCEIIEWNESNYDIKKNKYMYQAYQQKRWGFVPDYGRLDVIYEHGGIYLDTDVEIIRSIDELFEGTGFMGFEKGTKDAQGSVLVNAGQGFGAEPHDPVIKQLRDAYDSIDFALESGELNLTPSPQYTTQSLVALGLDQNNRFQKVGKLTVYPMDYFCPLDWESKKCKLTDNTYSIHHFDASWLSPAEKKRRRRERKLDHIKHIPNMLLMKVLGEKRYAKLKQSVKK